MGQHLVKNGFTPGYTRWVHHGEAHHQREEVVRLRLEDFDAEAGVADMIEDFNFFAECQPRHSAKNFNFFFFLILDFLWSLAIVLGATFLNLVIFFIHLAIFS
jgi:hypothetical protein